MGVVTIFESYKRLVKTVPDYKYFLTVDEMDANSRQLAKDHPDCVKLFEMGKSREGHPLLCLRIGEGEQNALIFGCPHPNEPIGAMLLEHFTKTLAEDEELRRELGYTWYIIKSWDVDGTKLNEGWFRGPFTLRNYFRNFYRPAGHQQVDWTFPVHYKELHVDDPIPETAAMMDLIDDIKPKFIYSLHNAGFGGVYWYMSGETPGIYEELRSVPKKYNVPLHLGEPETPYAQTFAPAVYKTLGSEASYDYVERYGKVDMKEYAKAQKTGNNSAAYARARHGSFTLLTELPYFYDPRIIDLSDSDISRKDAAICKLEEGAKTSEAIMEILSASQQYMGEKNYFLMAVEAFNKSTKSREASRLATIQMVSENPDFHRPATVAEKFDNLLVAKFYRATSAGMLVRAHEFELEQMEQYGEQNEAKKACLAEALAKAKVLFDELVGSLENEMNYDVIPIKTLVSIQLECGLMVAEYLKSHPDA